MNSLAVGLVGNAERAFVDAWTRKVLDLARDLVASLAIVVAAAVPHRHRAAACEKKKNQVEAGAVCFGQAHKYMQHGTCWGGWGGVERAWREGVGGNATVRNLSHL